MLYKVLNWFAELFNEDKNKDVFRPSVEYNKCFELFSMYKSPISFESAKGIVDFQFSDIDLIYASLEKFPAKKTLTVDIVLNDDKILRLTSELPDLLPFMDNLLTPLDNTLPDWHTKVVKSVYKRDFTVVYRRDEAMV